MAIVQISKIQQRAGNLVDLPQLDNAEFGWAADENRLFIGRTGNTYADENIEVLTSYSNISFSQINGSDGGNFNVVGPQNGQILTYVSSTDTWENYTGLNAQLDGAKLKLGDVSNISMTGGAIGYILETDGLGNLSWTPKNTLYTPVINLTNNSYDPLLHKDFLKYLVLVQIDLSHHLDNPLCFNSEINHKMYKKDLDELKSFGYFNLKFGEAGYVGVWE
jgi:hypothetical protein